LLSSNQTVMTRTDQAVVLSRKKEETYIHTYWRRYDSTMEKVALWVIQGFPYACTIRS
jgi:hypothetical protein